MRPPISWPDLRGRSVGIYGLGTEGRANLRAALAQGVEPVLVDDETGPVDPALGGRHVLGTASGGRDALLACDVVVKSPGISRYGDVISDLEHAGVQVTGGLALWLRGADRSRVLCITGTKGKSTTTALTGHLLRRMGYRTFTGGNLGLPPQDPDAGSDFDYWVIEVSSYQAADLSCSPPVVAVTSLHPDHLPWHAGEELVYFRDKLSATSQPGAELTVANGDSALLRQHEHLLGPRVQWVHSADEPDATWIGQLRLLGSHNRRNALIARASLIALGVPEAADDDAMTDAATGFAGLESRLSVLGTIGGVTFVDDNLSTNVLPTLAAVESFADRRVALIVGGRSRGIDYRPLGAGLRARALALRLFTIPDNGRDIGAQVEAAGAGPAVSMQDCDDLRAAVLTGYEWARPDGVVLLSPAAPSFGRFRDYRERGAAFAAAMAECRAD